MSSTYTTNLGIEKPGSGEQAGTWNTALNNNFDQFEQAISGYVAVSLSAAGSSGAPNIIKIFDSGDYSALSDGRNAFVEIDDVGTGDLTGDVYVQMTPDTSNKLTYVYNNLTTQDLIVFQGTYAAGRAYTVNNGDTVLLRMPGEGASASTVTALTAVGSVPDNAIGLAQLAHATQGDILYYGASGEPFFLGAGTAGYTLTTNGAGANPAWAASGTALDPTPDSDQTASGITASMTVGENVAFGTLLYMKSDGKLWKADADAAATMPAMYMALATILADADGSVLLSGFARDDAWSWTVSGTIYASTTAGALTQTAPSGVGDQIQVVGEATHADRIDFRPSPNLSEYV